MYFAQIKEYMCQVIYQVMPIPHRHASFIIEAISTLQEPNGADILEISKFIQVSDRTFQMHYDKMETFF